VRWRRRDSDPSEAFGSSGEPDLPADGATQFVAVTPTGRLAARAPLDELEGGHRLSPLFLAGHEVIAEVRLASDGEPS
jgi:hypothetical protein